MEIKNKTRNILAMISLLFMALSLIGIFSEIGFNNTALGLTIVILGLSCIAIGRYGFEPLEIKK